MFQSLNKLILVESNLISGYCSLSRAVLSKIRSVPCGLKFSSMVKGGHQQQKKQQHQSQSKSNRLHDQSILSQPSLKTIKSSSSLKSLVSQVSSLTTTNSSTTIAGPSRMKVYPIRALQDNYMYLLVDELTRYAAAVDPVNSSAMANAIADHGVDLKCILTTHHHYDHANGNGDMVSMYPDIVVYGGDSRVLALTKPVTHGEIIRLGTLTIECLSTPCHTRGHICYYVHNDELPGAGVQSFQTTATNTNDNQNIINVSNNPEFPASPPPPQVPGAAATAATTNATAAATATASRGSDGIPIERVVFTGDTLFIAGCGRFFEGTSEQMDYNLNTILSSLPNDTRVYCGHEYTVNNLKFALTVEPQNGDIKLKLDWAQNKVNKREPTVPSTIGEEKRINPFMRLNKPQVKKYAKEQSEFEVMSVLRQKKNEFVP